MPVARVYAQVTYPAPREHESYGYVVVPDASGSVELAVPPPGTGAEVVLIALADGHLPAVLGSVAAGPVIVVVGVLAAAATVGRRVGRTRRA